MSSKRIPGSLSDSLGKDGSSDTTIPGSSELQKIGDFFGGLSTLIDDLTSLSQS